MTDEQAEHAASMFAIRERIGASMFSNGVTPENVYRLVRALERIADELAEINLKWRV